MKITDVTIRMCSAQSVQTLTKVKLAPGRVPDVLVLTLRTDDGVEGTSFGFGGVDARLSGAAVSSLKEFFLGRDPMAREQNLYQFREFDRKWNLFPIYAYGPFDNACWDIAGKVAGLPVHDLLGRAHDELPVYASSMFHPGGVPAYVEEALEVKEAGFAGYKIHGPSPYRLDMAIHQAVREAVGPDFNLMSDPVATYTYAEAMRVGRQLEELDYLWLEEPVYDYDFNTLRRLARDLDIPIAATETPAGLHFITAEFISRECVDIVRTDASWRGGITAARKVAQLAESHGLPCEVHTSIYHPLEFANAHLALSIPNTTFFEVLFPLTDFGGGLQTPLPIGDGTFKAMTAPGLGVDYDWEWIERTTVGVY
ncbi:MAG: enolase C-terminal domain-like protein [Nostocoides sp.]